MYLPYLFIKVVIANSNKCWTYDYAYDGDSEQVQLYTQSVRPILEKIFKGNGVFIYHIKLYKLLCVFAKAKF